MAERKPKRQRFSLGGPAAGTSFEDYLTKPKDRVYSSEEEFDQENVNPEDVLEEEDYEEEEEEEAIRSAPAPASNRASTAGLKYSSKHLLDRIHIHQNNTKSSTAKDIYYLLQARMILPDAPVPVTRLLRVPAILLFQQLSEALFAAFDWGGNRSEYILEQRPQINTAAANTNEPDNELPNEKWEVASIKSPSGSGIHDMAPYKDLNTQKLRLMDIWNQTQIPEVRALKIFFDYDCFGDSQIACINFMGVADKGLRAADLGLAEISPGQEVWCIGGSGSCKPEYLPEDKIDTWEEETNRFEWDIDFHNSELSVVKVRDASFYMQ